MNQENQAFTENQPIKKNNIIKKWWFWVACALVIIIISTVAGKKSTEPNFDNPEESPSANSTVDNGETDNATMGEKNALSKAKSYLRTMAFSKKGLYEQLLFDGFTESCEHSFRYHAFHSIGTFS